MGNLKLAFRMLAKTPFVTVVAVASLALGIGANSAIFSIFDQILLGSLPVVEPDRLVNLGAPGPKPGSQSCNNSGGCELVFSYPMFRDLEQAETGFRLAAHRSFGANLATRDRTLNGRGTLVSGSYFSVLGVEPSLGRLLTPEDDRNPGEHTVAVLSHRFWATELGADPALLNQTLTVNGRQLTIVGVAPQGFDGTTLGFRPDVFVPLSMRAALDPGFRPDGFDRRLTYWAYVFGRLEPGTSIEQASARINTAYKGIINEVEAPLQEEMSAATMERFRAKEITLEAGQRGQSGMHEEARTPLVLLFSVTAVVLLIACANIANLLLARGAGRAQDMAIRGSLGASRRQLMSQLLTESLVLAALGGIAGLLVAHWTLALIGALLPPEGAATISLQSRPAAVLFAAGLAIGTGLLVGLYPALHSTRPDLVTGLKASSGQPGGSRSAIRFRHGLVTAQIALSTTLLVAAGLFIKSLANVTRVDLGLRSDNLIMFDIAPALNGYDTERSIELFERMEDELAAIPGVTAVTASMVALLAGNNWGSDVYVEGFQREPDTDANARHNRVGPGYFSTLGVPLLAGREFSEADSRGAAKVAIVNEAFVEKFGLGRDAVGKRMGESEEMDTEIIGVVENAKYSEVKDAVPPLFFYPYRQSELLGFLTFYARTGGDPSAVVRAIPDVIKRIDPNLPVDDLKTLDQQVRENIFIDRMISTLTTAFGGIASLLAGIGLYGVLSYTVAQRTREIGLRMALGATTMRVRTMVLAQVSRMMIVGAVLGLLGALAVGRVAETLLFGLEGNDPVVIAGATLLLAVIALSAAYVPALRASRVEPTQALRYE